MACFLCYSIHGEPLCGGWFVGPYHLTTWVLFFLPFVLPMYCTSTEPGGRFPVFLLISPSGAAIIASDNSKDRWGPAPKEKEIGEFTKRICAGWEKLGGFTIENEYLYKYNTSHTASPGDAGKEDG